MLQKPFGLQQLDQHVARVLARQGLQHHGTALRGHFVIHCLLLDGGAGHGGDGPPWRGRGPRVALRGAHLGGGAGPVLRRQGHESRGAGAEARARGAAAGPERRRGRRLRGRGLGLRGAVDAQVLLPAGQALDLEEVAEDALRRAPHEACGKVRVGRPRIVRGSRPDALRVAPARVGPGRVVVVVRGRGPARGGVLGAADQARAGIGTAQGRAASGVLGWADELQERVLDGGHRDHAAAFGNARGHAG
mmetsp:Transcript_34761/g.92212  ORF Transcript_34761/g.92212 Transcript_34761/m.92212 type:complete len:248 (+) Transcript_34761:510-1253(+)